MNYWRLVNGRGKGRPGPWQLAATNPPPRLPAGAIEWTDDPEASA